MNKLSEKLIKPKSELKLWTMTELANKQNKALFTIGIIGILLLVTKSNILMWVNAVLLLIVNFVFGKLKSKIERQQNMEGNGNE